MKKSPAFPVVEVTVGLCDGVNSISEDILVLVIKDCLVEKKWPYFPSVITVEYLCQTMLLFVSVVFPFTCF